METINEYQQVLNQLMGIAPDKIKTPDIPVDSFLQESENLYQWAVDDKDALLARGLNEEYLNQLQVGAGALRYAEGQWFKQRHGKQEAEKEWAERSPLAYDLRDNLIYEFEFAFIGDSDLLARVSEIRDGSTNADMIQDLTNLALLGKDNLPLLEKTNFDESLLNKAEIESNQLAEVLARANGDKADDSEAKLMRDRAYTFLRKHVDEVRRTGRFVFRKNRDRKVGYMNQYKNKHR